jgi:hypothetical protein
LHAAVFHAAVLEILGADLQGLGFVAGREKGVFVCKQSVGYTVLHIQAMGFPMDPTGADFTLSWYASVAPHAGRGWRTRLGAFLGAETREHLRRRCQEVCEPHRPVVGSPPGTLAALGIEARFTRYQGPLPVDVWLPFWTNEELRDWLTWLAPMLGAMAQQVADAERLATTERLAVSPLAGWARWPGRSRT